MKDKKTHLDIKDIIKVIRYIKYFRLDETTTTICSMMLENGFVVIGTSACVDPQKYEKEIGERIAYDKALEKVWELESYLLQQRFFDEKF